VKPDMQKELSITCAFICFELVRLIFFPSPTISTQTKTKMSPKLFSKQKQNMLLKSCTYC
jgi:hypothetical protein